MYYAGVGSRKTPLHIVQLMEAIAKKMAFFGYTLRSGGALGADQAFERGAGSLKEIYYVDKAIITIGTNIQTLYYDGATLEQAQKLASRFHGAWHKCPPFVRKLHGRNAFQILGLGLNDPSSYCICWTPDGCINHIDRSILTGGTGTAISIANYVNTPVVNLFNKSEYNKWNAWAHAA